MRPVSVNSLQLSSTFFNCLQLSSALSNSLQLSSTFLVHDRSLYQLSSTHFNPSTIEPYLNSCRDHATQLCSTFFQFAIEPIPSFFNFLDSLFQLSSVFWFALKQTSALKERESVYSNEAVLKWETIKGRQPWSLAAAASRAGRPEAEGLLVVEDLDGALGVARNIARSIATYGND